MLRVLALVALVGCVGLLAAGCGGGSGSRSVAHLGSTTTSASSGGGSAALTPQQEIAIDVAYAACLNRNGVQVSALRTGGLAWYTAPGVPGPGSPQDAAAERDCKSLLPKGGLPRIPTSHPREVRRPALSRELVRVAAKVLDRSRGSPLRCL
jgi:hypothetical protein